MKRFLTLFFTFLPFLSISQNSVKNARQKSWQTFAYRVSASEIAQFIQWDSIPVKRFADLTPAFVSQTEFYLGG